VKHNPTSIALLGILLLATALRLGCLDLTEFKFDEALVCNRAAEFVDSGRLPTTGIGSSVGVANPPLAVILMALPVAVARDPILASGFVALLNVGAVLGCFWLGRRYFGNGVGLLATLLFAVSPWAVFYSRKVWAQDMLPPFTMLFFIALFATVVAERPWALVGAFAALACLVQVHLSALAFIPLLFLVLLLFHKQVHIAPLAVGVGLAFLLFAPYLLHEAAHGWGNLRGAFSVAGGPAKVGPQAIRYALLNVGGEALHALAGGSWRAFLAGIVNLRGLDLAEQALFVSGVLFLTIWTFALWRGEHEAGISSRRRAFVLLLLWVLVPVLFFLRHSTPVYPHYLVILYPATYLVIAILVVEIVKRARKQRQIVATGLPLALAVLLIGIAAWQVYLTLAWYRFVDSHSTSGGHGAPVKYAVHTAATIHRLADETGNPQVILLTRGDDPAYASAPAIFQFMLGSELSPRFVDARQAMIFPNSELDTVYCLTPDVDDTPAAEWLERFAVALPAEEVLVRGGPQTYRFYRLPAGAPQRIASRIASDSEPTVFANGVTLLGHQALGEASPGHTIRLILWWLSPQAPDDADYHFFNHLLDEEGHRWGQRDGPGYPTRAWRTGDLIVSWFDVEIAADAPPGPFWVRTGMYTYPDVMGVPVVDAQGQPVSDAVEWEP
jgi:4-amino-4-deoxy-L-arabinose transferase-like glycosyltransferase